MSLKGLIKWFMPHGLYVSHKEKKAEKNRQIHHRGKVEAVVLAEEATKYIGNEWISNEYYNEAEKSLSIFWSEDSIFYKNFSQLDCAYIVEIACGHGRHVQNYIEQVQKATLVDINKENISFCKNRFSQEQKIEYLCNNGRDLKEIETKSQTAIFTYDAMVHFELLDIYEYLKESNRILKDNGKILFHHSNAGFSPELPYNLKPHGRNFMSADIFAYLALRTGFVVLEQNIFSWGARDTFAKDIDCLSLCQKVKTIT